MSDVNLVNTVFIGVLIVFIFIISMIALKNWANFENAKEEISSLKRAIEDKDNFRNRDISNLNQKLSYLKEWDYRQEQEIKNLRACRGINIKRIEFLEEEKLHLENAIKVSYEACENLAKENELLKKQNEELRLNERVDEPCENPYNDDLFKCHCGSEDFIELNRNGLKGIKGVPPYVELEIQCVKCGGIHKIKDEPYSDKYSYKKSTD